MKIQEKMTTGGVDGSSSIKGLVAEHISKELADRLLSKTLKSTFKNGTLYISNNGNDETADGTQEKPFKTVMACLSFVYEKYRYYGITVKFLTDYTTEQISLRRDGQNSAITFDGEGHNVIFKSPRIFEGRYGFKNCTIQNITDNACLYISEIAHVYLVDGCILENTQGTIKIPFVACRRNAYFSFNGNNTLKITQPFLCFVQCLNNGYIEFDKYSSLTIQGDAEHDAFFSCGDNAKISVFTTSITGTLTHGKKYNLVQNSCLNLNGRGTAIVPSANDGTKDETSIIC